MHNRLTCAVITATTMAALPVLANDLTHEQVQTDIDLARAAFADIHPGYDRFTETSEIEAGWDAIIDNAKAANGLDVASFYLGISQALARIRCDHTKAELPSRMKKARKTAPVYLPFRWSVVEGRAIVEAADEATGLFAGDEILRIDGRSIGELRTRLHPYIPVDGYNDHTKDALMTASLEHMGGAVDHFGALLFDVPEVAVLDVVSPSGTARTVQLARVGHDAWKAVAVEDNARAFKDAVSLERVGETSAILRVDTFVNYRDPVDPDSIYAPVFEALREEGRDRLILDLRRNGGGSTDASQGLFAYFIDKTRRMKTAEIFKTLDHSAYVDYISTWDKRVVNPPRIGFTKTETGEYAVRGLFSDATDRIKPAKARFDGELIILTSRNNSSGATNLIASVQAARPVTLVGEATGGNPLGPTAGTIFFLKLPESGVTLRLPVIRQVNNVGDLPKGRGLVPDVEAPVTVDSLRAGRDPAMEAALSLLDD